jgi:hypothetical protein
MRTLLAIVILAALGWSGFWYWQASMRDRALTRWLDERRADGWVAEAEDIRVTGYPSRVDAIVTRLDLADPEAGWAWQADEFRVMSLSYKPNHVIVALPGEQTVATPYQTLHAVSDNLRGSVVFRPTPRLELDRSTFEIGNMRITADSGWQASVGKAVLATRQAEDGTPFAHDVAFNGENLVLPEGLTAGLGDPAILPAGIGPVALDMTLRFDRPWDRPALEGENPVLEEVDIRDISLTWGKLDLRGRGTLDVDAEGFADGRLDLRARNWRDMVDLAVSAGALNPNLAGAVRGGLDLIARFAGDGDALNVPLDFEDGMTRLGPIVIGPAPQLARRG